MRAILRKRSLQFVFAANVISMFGSGMNAAAVAWFVLKATGSPMALGTLTVLNSLPAMLLMPFSGVLIDREDRRRLVMWLDALRALVILAVAMLALLGHVRVWQLYVMNMLVATGFWMFWPTVTALIQELTPDSEYVQSNTLLLVGVQGGWMIAGSVVGFVYEHIGIGGVLLIDALTYGVSFLCYFWVRRGRHVVPRPAELRADILAAETALARFARELREGFDFLRTRPALRLLGASWALFLGAMLTSHVVTAPLSDQVFHAGARGYGWLNAGWGVGAFISGLFAAAMLRRSGSRRSVAMSMFVLSIGALAAPFSPVLAAAVLIYGVMGAARGLSGVAMNTQMMESVPSHFMGRVQNSFNFVGTALQIVLSLATGIVAHRFGLRYGFGLIALAYALAFVFAAWMPSTAAAATAEVGAAN
jgi:DHA3 family macrolide efflux protein-like MFS transporter